MKRFIAIPVLAALMLVSTSAYAGIVDSARIYVTLTANNSVQAVAPGEEEVQSLQFQVSVKDIEDVFVESIAIGYRPSSLSAKPVKTITLLDDSGYANTSADLDSGNYDGVGFGVSQIIEKGETKVFTVHADISELAKDGESYRLYVESINAHGISSQNPAKKSVKAIGKENIVFDAGLIVSKSVESPQSQIVPAGSSKFAMLKFNLESFGDDVLVDKIDLKYSGLNDGNEISKVWLTVNAGSAGGGTVTPYIADDGTITFDGDFVVVEGSANQLTILVDLTNSADSGETGKISVDEITGKTLSTATSVTAVGTAEGNVMAYTDL